LGSYEGFGLSISAFNDKEIENNKKVKINNFI